MCTCVRTCALVVMRVRVHVCACPVALTPDTVSPLCSPAAPDYFAKHMGDYEDVLASLETLNLSILKAMDFTKKVSECVCVGASLFTAMNNQFTERNHM